MALYIPASAYVCVGFGSADVFPSPNCQNHVSIPTPSGGTTVDVSVNVVGSPTHTVSALNPAIGPGLTLMESLQLVLHPY